MYFSLDHVTLPKLVTLPPVDPLPFQIGSFFYTLFETPFIYSQITGSDMSDPWAESAMSYLRTCIMQAPAQNVRNTYVLNKPYLK